MRDIRKNNSFYYSQNSLNTFLKCPFKFKLKYINGVSWKKDSPIDVEYYKNIKKGLDFHLICERYFLDIPLGLEKKEYIDKDLLNWTNNLIEKFPKKKQKKYLPEYEIKMKKNNIRIQAKYDLIILHDNKIYIIDFKTEERKLTHKEMKKRFQTILYMYIMYEKAKEIFNIDVQAIDIKMIFWQPKFKEDFIEIEYSEKIHLENEIIIKNTINTIDEYNFELDFNKNLYKSHCKFCEFNYLCNNSRVDFDLD
ncbi:PD-(D/E)XK nuclease superfamily protein [Clostridium acetireducens DSM 10703]|jgi:CRISPR/Cas system-associated exonuclease Cas4 (RecB family)|uniref:PD-(D/E)XK nuclease superfamily protein n=1 Tax=Clostridium acetireducens DSM 10703 TaxID=1121290 RepID=A0A1E8F0M2_9CLOT|nr:PD-(D/E)XK nuclease family protein [Clostridium acetireducens]OFI07003.1 PD-(D/E)XK nuclease superfamily protein [Clostridium acetireducens DSM 10703]